MRAKSIILLVLALSCGLVASIGITQMMAKRGKTGPANVGQSEKIFVAMTDIPMGDPITPQMVKLEQWPKDNVPEGALTKLDDIEGRRPKMKILAKTPILNTYLLTKGASEQGATGLIPKGYRVVSVKVDQVSGGASLIRPGDRVDVLVHVEKSESRGISETSTQTVLQDIKVFAVDDVFVLDSTDKEEAKTTAKTISLLVKPDQAEMVTLASELGKIRLVMRSPEDDEQPTIAGATAQQIFGNTSGSDRQNEDLVKQKPTSNTNEEFIKFLSQQKKKAAEQPVAAPTAPVGPAEPEVQSWRMRVLSGGEVNETILQSDGPEPAGTDGMDSIRWTLQAPGTGGGAMPPIAAPPAPTPPAAAPAETPQETPVSTGPAPATDGPAVDEPATDAPASDSSSPMNKG